MVWAESQQERCSHPCSPGYRFLHNGFLDHFQGIDVINVCISQNIQCLKKLERTVLDCRTLVSKTSFITVLLAVLDLSFLVQLSGSQTPGFKWPSLSVVSHPPRPWFLSVWGGAVPCVTDSFQGKQWECFPGAGQLLLLL